MLRRAALIILTAPIFAPAVLPAPAAAENKKIVFFGDSLTAGYGLLENQSFPSMVQEHLDRDGLKWDAVNAGISGDTTSSGAKRISWILKSSPTVVFVALGANDGLRGLDPALTRKNLESILARSKKSGAKVVLAGMQLPMNYGAGYREAFRRLYPETAKKYNANFYPFLLEGVAARPELNLPDGIHPNEAGQKILAEKVYAFIKPILEAAR